MTILLGIWSEAHQAYVCWTSSPEKSLYLWCRRGYQRPNEKMVLVISRGREREPIGERITTAGYSKETIQQLLHELDTLEQEGLWGFGVRRYL